LLKKIILKSWCLRVFVADKLVKTPDNKNLRIYSHESQGIGQGDLRALQADQAQGRAAGGLQEPPTQTAPGLIPFPSKSITQLFLREDKKWPESLVWIYPGRKGWR
jgi:hypothetical protein